VADPGTADAPTVEDDVATTTWQVGEVARATGVTVRTLHHYDEQGLLVPSVRGDNGYRRYDADDLARLQRIRFYRELGFGLTQIRSLLDGDEPALDHLRRQHELLLARRDRLDRLLTTLELTMDAEKAGVRLTPEEMFEVFGDTYDPAWAAEAEQRWGDTDAWAQSRQRTTRYGKDDWQRIQDEAERVTSRLAAALAAGEPADGEVAMDLAEEARQHIDRWFYDLSHAGHRSLATMYVTDPRFTATYEDVAEGLAVYVRDAVHANAARHGVTEDGW
jgi:DNA-binding transcriptional MerR regulator